MKKTPYIFLGIVVFVSIIFVYLFFSLPSKDTDPMVGADEYGGIYAMECVDKYPQEKDRGCCLASLAEMRAKKYKIATKNNTCPAGYNLNQLLCLGSLKWCEPIVSDIQPKNVFVSDWSQPTAKTYTEYLGVKMLNGYEMAIEKTTNKTNPNYYASLRTKYDTLLSSFGYITDLKDDADGVFGSRWGYKKDGTHVIFDSGVQDPHAIKNNDDPYEFTCPCKNTLTVFSENKEILQQIMNAQFTKADSSVSVTIPETMWPDRQPVSVDDLPYTACACGCCGSQPKEQCLYRSKGDNLEKIKQDDLNFSKNNNCAVMGCSLGIRYQYCD